MHNYTKFEDLVGRTLIRVDGATSGSDEITLTTDNGERFRMYHSQDCCETVNVEDVCGDVADLIGNPILLAEDVESDANPEGVEKSYQDSFTWTFYKLSTIKGSVTIRWYGESNGYYSESVSFARVEH